MTPATETALKLLAGAVNALLTVERRQHRVTPEIVMTRQAEYTIIALRETTSAADWQPCGRPYSTMNEERDGM